MSYLADAVKASFQNQSTNELTEIQARQILADFHAELNDVQEAQEVLSKLTYLKDNAEGANPALIVEAINGALTNVPALQIDLPSMESAEENFELSMEGLSDIVGKVKDFIADKWKGLKEKMDKFKDAITWAFRGQVSRCDKLLEEISTKGLIEDKEITVPEKDMEYLQKIGKPSKDLVKDFNAFAKEANAIYSEKPLEVQLSELEKGDWKNYFDAMKAYDRAYRAFLAATKSTEKNLPDGVKIKKPYIGFATPQQLGGFAHVSVMQKKDLGDGKTQVLNFVSQRAFGDSPKVYKKAGPKFPALDEQSLRKLVEAIKDSSLYAEGNLASLWKQYDRLDEVFDTVIAQVEGAEFSREQINTLTNMTYSVFWSSIYYMELMLNGFEECGDNLIKFAKLHVK